MNEHQADELWVRYLEGDMTSRERAALNQSLVYQSHRRERLTDDFELDGMLQVLGHIETTADEFVAQVAGRLDEDEVSEFPLASGEEAASVGRSGNPPTVLDTPTASSDWPSAANRVAPPPVPPPVMSECADVTAGNVNEVERVSRSEFPVRVSQSSRWTYALAAAALIVITLVSAIIIVANRNGDRVAEEPVKKQPQATDKVQPDSIRDEVAIDQPEKQIIEKPVPEIDDVAPQVVQDPSLPTKEIPDDRVMVGIEKSPKESVGVKPLHSNPSDIPFENSKVLGQLTKSIRAVWKTEPQTTLAKEPLHLESGIVEITMNDRVVLTILGPADFQLESIGHVTLSQGRLNALVPGQATGFTVNTPGSQVVDLGTEFDVSVDKDGETAVRVHQGKVEFASLSAEDADHKKWNLHEGQFRSIQRDGVSYDFYLATTLDPSGRGTVSINGIQFAVLDRKQFDAARLKVNKEVAQFKSAVVSQPDGKFSGLMNLNGKPTPFLNSVQFARACRQANDHFDAAERLLNRAGTFRGSININGTEIKFDNMQDMLDQNQWIKQMGIRVPRGGVGNLREVMKMQEEMMRKLRESGEASEEKPDMRGSIDIDGKSIDFGNLEELLRLRDSLRGGLRGDDPRDRIEKLRQRQEETRNRNRERLRESVIPAP